MKSKCCIVLVMTFSWEEQANVQSDKLATLCLCFLRCCIHSLVKNQLMTNKAPTLYVAGYRYQHTLFQSHWDNVLVPTVQNLNPHTVNMTSWWWMAISTLQCSGCFPFKTTGKRLGSRPGLHLAAMHVLIPRSVGLHGPQENRPLLWSLQCPPQPCSDTQAQCPARGNARSSAWLETKHAVPPERHRVSPTLSCEHCLSRVRPRLVCTYVDALSTFR